MKTIIKSNERLSLIYSKRSVSDFTRISSSLFFLFALTGSAILMQDQALNEPDINDLSSKNIISEEVLLIDEYLMGALKGFLRADQIELNKEELKARAKSFNSYHKIDILPSAVLYPESTEDVSKILQVCSRFKVPVVAMGGSTSLEGQALNLREGGINLDFSRMKKVVAFHEHDLDITVEAGLGYVELNEFLQSKGLWFPLDPGPGASIGGMCSCRCSGSTAVRYGSMRDNVLSVKGVLADGTVFHTGSRARKSSAGYDLTRLLVGAEGTLAIITEVTLKLHGIPKFSNALRISFPGGVREAACTARDSLNCGVTIGRCELMDEEMIKVLNQANPNDLLGVWPEVTTLLYEVSGISEASVREQSEIVKDLAKRNNASSILTYTKAEEMKHLWKLRKECLWSSMSQFPDREPMITDVCVPLSNLPTLIEESRDYIDQNLTLPCQIIAHAGDGNFHVLIFFKPDDPKEAKDAKTFANWMATKAIALGGTCTGEHGVGIGKKELLKLEMGSSAISIMQKIKHSLDEQGLLNPGKIFDLPSASSSGGNK